MAKEFIRTDEITGLWAYLVSIDWTEPWFLGLAVFHVVCAAATFLTKNHLTLQGIVFAAFLVMVGCSEYINTFAATHWRRFARQQYFDSNGLFISIVFSVPILVNCLIIVVVWLKTSADLMRGIRLKQLQQKVRQQGKASAASPDTQGEQPDDSSKGETSQRTTRSKTRKTD